MSAPRVAVVGLWHETNTYAPIPADLAAFRAFELLTGDDVRRHHAGTRSVIGGFLDCPGADLVPAFSAGAWPSGPAPKDTLTALFEHLEAELRRVAARAPLAGVLLNLHGAMVGEGCDDVEARTARLVRDVVGDVPSAAVLDLHANPSPEFVELTDIVISYDTYPHVDMWERGREAADLLVDAIGGRSLQTVVAKVPLLTCPLAQATDAEPMRGLIRRARRRAADAGVARIGITAGFPYSDVERAGVSVLAVGDADRIDAARAVANATADDIAGIAAGFEVPLIEPAAAVADALARRDRPVVLADVADNIGGGSPGDGTVLLQELIDQQAPDAVVTIADAEVAALAATAGVGRRVDVELGAKSDDLHGSPVRAAAEVLAVNDGRYRSAGTWMTGQTFDMGATALLRIGGVRVIVTTRPTPPFHREQYGVVGIDPASVGIIVAKGAVAWRSAIPEAVDPIEVNTPGVCPIDTSSLPRATAPRGARA